MARLKDLKTKWMRDPAFREEYAHTVEEFRLIKLLVRARLAANLTQAEVAERTGSTKSAVARLEDKGVSPTLATVVRYAKAVGARLDVEVARLSADDGELAPDPRTAESGQGQPSSLARNRMKGVVT